MATSSPPLAQVKLVVAPYVTAQMRFAYPPMDALAQLNSNADFAIHTYPTSGIWNTNTTFNIWIVGFLYFNFCVAVTQVVTRRMCWSMPLQLVSTFWRLLRIHVCELTNHINRAYYSGVVKLSEVAKFFRWVFVSRNRLLGGKVLLKFGVLCWHSYTHWTVESLYFSSYANEWSFPIHPRALVLLGGCFGTVIDPSLATLALTRVVLKLNAAALPLASSVDTVLKRDQLWQSVKVRLYF